MYCIIRIICLKNKRINCSAQVCFHINHPKASQHTISNKCCRQRKAHHSKQDNVTSHKRGKILQHFSVSRSCPNSSRYKNAQLQPSTNEHPTSHLFALAIINSDTNFYRYIAIYLCIYLQCVHNLNTTSDGIRASLLWQETATERVHARRVFNSVFRESPMCKRLIFVVEDLERIQ